jgi:hypothetical protein
MEKDRVLTFFKKLRNVSIHQKQDNPRFQSSFAVADFFAMLSGSTSVLGDKNEDAYLTSASVAEVAATDVTKIHRIQKWYFDEKSDENVIIPLCERYLSIMVSMFTNVGRNLTPPRRID